MTILPGTVVAATFDVVVGGHWRNDDESAFAQLLGVTQDDLGASVVILDRTFDFNHSAFELLNVTNLFQIVREHDDREGTCLVVLAEGEEGDAVAAIGHMQHGPADALGGAHMLARFCEGDAVMLGSIARGANPAHCNIGSKEGTEKASQSKKTHDG